ncbi:MAG: hypothetical protein U0V74_05910 [Chitinophagales bacterium]
MAIGKITLQLKQHLKGLKPGMLYFLSAVLFSLVLSPQIAAYGQFSAAEASLIKDNQIFCSAEGSDFQLPKFDLPFESPFTPDHREMPKGNESEDDFDTDWDFIAESDGDNFAEEFVLVKDWAPHFSAFIANRSSVPLFVLHHSWKSFIA